MIVGVVASALALTAAAGPAAMPTLPNIGWSDRGVFVFSGFPIDFRSKVEGIGLDNKFVQDCSTVKDYCASGERLNLVLPKKCSGLGETNSFSAADVTTSILLRSADQPANRIAHTQVPTEILLLKSSNSPFLYLYERPIGVTAILIPKTDLASILHKIRSEGFDAIQEMFNDKILERYNLVTFDPFGSCSVKE